MRTTAIILLATVNLALLISVALPMFRHDSAPVALTAPTGSAASDKGASIEPVTTQGKPALMANTGLKTDAAIKGTGTPAAKAAAKGNAVAKTGDAALLYVKEDENTDGPRPGARYESDGKDIADGKSIADVKDEKDVEPIAELLPGGETILTGPADPNSEFVSIPAPSSGGESSTRKTLGIFAPVQISNTVPPTVSEETPL